eukprot:CAMPEP_0206274896 /NCGR_PEP_ID=MMETSP0047_2-20121206/35416_1 /ASSEMBLY_ACC=CAM_ASM_000192 /TAXON_ID=195065 /ORGANISM="Chroomonas mesostigmatica_cf, Strain CCMP1168" /LENGTH=235 /DNA_ID=CAMNT_0053704175 /DNA_START=68 /DNA_END=777 /DNA_ORIENTATION=+
MVETRGVHRTTCALWPGPRGVHGAGTMKDLFQACRDSALGGRLKVLASRQAEGTQQAQKRSWMKELRQIVSHRALWQLSSLTARHRTLSRHAARLWRAWRLWVRLLLGQGLLAVLGRLVEAKSSKGFERFRALQEEIEELRGEEQAGKTLARELQSVRDPTDDLKAADHVPPELQEVLRAPRGGGGGRGWYEESKDSPRQTFPDLGQRFVPPQLLQLPLGVVKTFVSQFTGPSLE